MVPEFAEYPFYYSGGFIGERMVVVLLHGVMTAVAVTGFVKDGKGLLMGHTGATLLHAFTNVGATLYQIKLWDALFASLYLALPVLVVIFIFERLRKEGLKERKQTEVVLFGRD